MDILNEFNQMRDTQVQQENKMFLCTLGSVIRTQTEYHMNHIDLVDGALRDSMKHYNEHVATASLLIDLSSFLPPKEIYKENTGFSPNPEYKSYTLYWQPKHIHEPDARQVTVALESQCEPFKRLLLTAAVPELEEFRQFLRTRYPGASISSLYTGGSKPNIIITVSYTLEKQKGIEIATGTAVTTKGVVWTNATI